MYSPGSYRIGPHSFKEPDFEFWIGRRRHRIGSRSVKDPKRGIFKACIVIALVLVVSKSQKMSFGVVGIVIELVTVVFLWVILGGMGVT